MTDREELEAMNKINRLEVKDYTDEHIMFIDEFQKGLHLSINDDIEQSLHDKLVKLGWTPPKKENLV